MPLCYNWILINTIFKNLKDVSALNLCICDDKSIHNSLETLCKKFSLNTHINFDSTDVVLFDDTKVMISVWKRADALQTIDIYLKK